MNDQLGLGGWFTLEVYDKDGNFKGATKSHNGITAQGLMWILNAGLHNSGGAYAVSTWYCALASTNTAFASTMTYAVPSFTEVNANYSEATRPSYVNVTASTNSMITNSASKAAFTIATASTSIYGAALMSSNVKGDTATSGGVAGILFCYALLSTARDVVVGDTLNLTYQVSAS
jgi:hypothetical protein